MGGGYLLGEGAYDVRFMLLDDTGRTCRKTWHVDVHRNHAEQKVKINMPPETVWELSLRGARQLPGATDDTARAAHDHLPAHRAALPAPHSPAPQ